MSTAPLVPKQLESILQEATLEMLGIDSGTDPNAYKKVRIGWQAGGQPAWPIPDDVSFLRVVEDDDPINRTRDRTNLANDSVSITQVDSYLRVWRVFWVVYGPNSFEQARKIRSGLFNDRIHDLLAQANLYWVTDVSAPRRVPELYQGQWWERVDFEALFNELVKESAPVPTAASSEVVVIKENGLTDDVQIQP